jgi:parallel beta-helix repeat protein
MPLAFSPGWSTVINVPGDYPTIQQGIDASSDGDTVLVQPDVYNENLNFNGHNILLGSLFITTNDTSYISTTIIDGDSLGTVITFTGGENNNACVAGFTIRHGLTAFGAGIFCENSDPVIRNNLITENKAVGQGYPHFDGDGGGIYCYDSDAIITENVFRDNIADLWGGAICCLQYSNGDITFNHIENNSATYGGGIKTGGWADPTITGNTVIGNTAQSQGGGIEIYNSSSKVSGNIIIDNIAVERGGAFNCTYNAAPIINNNIICDNTAVSYAGGFYISSNTDVMLINNTVFGNTAPFAGGMYCTNACDLYIINTIVRNNAPEEIYFSQYMNPNTVTVEYSNIQGGQSGIFTNNNGTVNWLEGNIDFDPVFRNYVDDDFHLMAILCGDSADSPCIDAGHPDSVDNILDCRFGLGGPRSDMGAYGGNNGDWPTSIMDNHQIQNMNLPEDIFLLQNYPNPFNAKTTIRFVLMKSQDINLAVYDLLGRKIETLLDEWLPAGTHGVTWDAEYYSSGTYFYTLRSVDKAETKKMILIK